MNRSPSRFARCDEALFSDSALFLVALTPDGRVERVGARALAPFGFASDAALGRPFEEGPWWRASPSGARARLRAALDRARGREPCNVILPLVSSLGRRHEIDMAITPIGEDGPDAFLLVVGTDITVERRRKRLRERARERFRKLERRYVRDVLAASGVIVWRLDVASRRVEAEPALARLYGLEEGREEPATLDGYLARVHRDDARRVARGIEHAIDTGEPFVSTHRVHGENGAVQWLIARGEAERDAVGAVSHLIGIVLDVTPENVAVEALEANEARYRRLFESVQEGFCVLEPIRDDAGDVVDARYAEVNPAFERQAGLRDVEGRRVGETTPRFGSRWLDDVARVVESGEPARRVDRAPDPERWTEISLCRTNGGEDARVVCLFRDVTDTRRVEQRLRGLAEQLAEEGRRRNAFLATLAHELRNPLAPVRHGLELLREAAGEERERLRTMMERQVAHTSRLVDDLLDVSRLTHDKLVLHEGVITVGELVADAVETIRPSVERRRQALRTAVPAPDTLLRVDPERIAQVLSNLLSNAARYTPEGGHVELGVDRDERGLHVVVSDDGRGLEEGALERVFEMFAQVRGGTSDRGGLGLGLTLARRIAEMHGGTLEVDSRGLGQGSAFTLTLPPVRVLEGAAPPPSPESTRPPASPSAPPGRRLRVLVVDDNRDAADTLVRVLRARGLDAAAEYAGAGALERTADTEFDALVLDIGMPGIDGREVARRYRARGGKATLIALTGWGTDDDVERSLAAGFDHHLTKPAAARAVLELLGRPSAG